ncbi:MAG TPA: redoxin family protein [Bryobacteraceae bacterium]|nr:redoxin family protein [Bryobacteraceae bacterium]
MFPLVLFYASLVSDVRGAIAQHDQAAAAREVQGYQAKTGATPELAEAISWLARDALAARRLDQADAYARQSLKMAERLLGVRRLDTDASLTTAVGASIEVHAQVLAAEGKRGEALGFLLDNLKVYSGSSIAERLHKNVDLLSLEGKTAPPIAITEWVGPKPPALSALRGHPVLLFFWAHWCPDCKAMVPFLADLERAYGPKGLALLAPTKRYGYVAGGEPAGPEAEKRYIDQVRRQYYAGLGDLPAPISSAAFEAYGASTTPTLVLLDRAGVVRLYHPGAMSEAELGRDISSLIGK